MHATAISWVLLTLAGQISGDYGAGGYGETPTSEFGPRMSVRAETRTRATTRATNPLTGSYPSDRVATQPRYGAETPSYESTLPPVGETGRMIQEDPQSALANKLLRDMITPTRADQNVQALRLVDALERTTGSQQQFAAIKTYWDWSLAVSELHGVLEEDTILARLGVPRNKHESDSHIANRKASRSRLEDSQLDVAAQVTDLLEATGVRTTSAIRPSDVPFTGTYNTNFSKIFPNSTGPITLKKIHQTLPYALKVVRSRADSYESARAAMGSTRDAYQAGQASYDEFTDSLALLRSQRRAFLDSVHDYNFGIAEYALSIAGPGLGRETVVSMLIRTANPGPYRGASLDYSSDILPVSGTQEIPGETYESYRAPTDLGNQPVRRQVHSVMVR